MTKQIKPTHALITGADSHPGHEQSCNRRHENGHFRIGALSAPRNVVRGRRPSAQINALIRPHGYSSEYRQRSTLLCFPDDQTDNFCGVFSFPATNILEGALKNGFPAPAMPMPPDTGKYVDERL